MSLASARFSARLWLSAVVVAVVFGASLALADRFGSVEVRPLRGSLESLPLQIEAYRGEARELDPQVARRVGAIDSVSRVYTDPVAGSEISCYLAAFTALGEPTLPHPPAICYRLSGADVVAQRSITIPAQSPIKAQLLTVEREGVRSYVVYWYSWEDKVCATRPQAMLARLKLAGRSQWPPLVKVLLETPVGSSPDEALQAITDFAAHVRDETAHL